MTNNLQQQGIKILEITKLLDRLNEVGEAYLVGNMAFETTIKPDIDIQIYPHTNFQDTALKVQEILESICARNIVVRKLKISKKTLILSNFDYEGKIWNIDVALTNKSNDYLYDSYQYYLDNINSFNNESRKLIIQFKEMFCHTKLRFDNPSYYIYQGVLEKGIRTKDEMLEYLKEMEKQLRGKK